MSEQHTPDLHDQHLFADLHAHPAFKPLSIEKKSLWDTIGKNKVKALVKAQLKGKRGGSYDQASFPKLTNAKVKIVFASIYPLEQGVMVNKNILLGILNIPLGIFNSIFGLFGKNLHIKDFAVNIFTKFPTKRVQYLKDQEYWDGFLEEYEKYKAENRLETNIADKNIEELSSLSEKRKEDFPNTFEVKKKGVYQIADGSWEKELPNGNKVLTVLTMEGIGIISQTKKNNPNTKHGTKIENEKTIFEHIKYLKEQTPLFFITFSHHFSSGLCGHARSFPTFTRDFSILNQEHFINRDFSELGYRVLKNLLAIKQQGAGWVDDPDAGRRIFIDIKHMSIKGRLTLYQLVRTYNEGKDDSQKIPIIASHLGFSDVRLGQMLRQANDEKSSTQVLPPTTRYGREHSFNTWSINLCIEEIGWIVESGGLIGLCMDQNILGVGFGKKTKKKDPTFFTHLVMNQLLSMAKASKTPKFWNHIMFGTDFDGLIDPIDHYSSSLFFYNLKINLKKELLALNDEEAAEASFDKEKIDLILHNLSIGNATNFLKRHFNKDQMPVIS